MMTKKYITYAEAIQKTDEQYARLKAEIEAGFQAETDYHTCSECKEWQARWDKLIAFMEAEHDRLETEQYHEGGEGNYDIASDRRIQKLQTWDILDKARAIRDDPATISILEDLSGNEHHAIQRDIAKRPRIVKDADGLTDDATAIPSPPPNHP